MIIDFDHNPYATNEQKLQSLMESIQLALNELTDAVANLKKEVEDLKRAVGE